MKSLKNLTLTRSVIAAAVASSGFAAPVVSHAIVASGPATGMVCRVGYTAEFSGTNLKCKKFASVDTPLMCDQAAFPKYVIRDGTGTDGRKDVCALPNLDISSNGPLPGSGYVFAVIDTAEAARRVIKAGQDEAAALGLPVSGVQTVQSITFPEVNGAGNNVKDLSHTQLHHYTFAIPAGGPIVIGNPGPVGVPATATATTPFVPRPLP